MFPRAIGITLGLLLSACFVDAASACSQDPAINNICPVTTDEPVDAILRHAEEGGGHDPHAPT